MPNRRRRLRGVVVSDKMEKTVVVEVETVQRHPLYGKIVRSFKRYMAHNEDNKAKTGDFVQIVETRPLSKHKRWAVETILSAGAVGAPLEEEGNL
jgi:small subunit ribosomal protein S17